MPAVTYAGLIRIVFLVIWRVKEGGRHLQAPPPLVVSGKQELFKSEIGGRFSLWLDNLIGRCKYLPLAAE